MKAEAKNQIALIFCNHHNIQVGSLMERLKTLIAEVHAPFLLFIECLELDSFKARQNPFDGFFINMLHRAANVFGGMASLIASGHLQEAESLSRSLAESSLKMMHLHKGDVPNNIAQYLASYFSESSWKTERWQSALNDYDIHPHNRLIQEKSSTEEGAKEICRMFVEAAGYMWPEKASSINIDKIFKDLEKDIEYRTVYRAMCGQPHQNPEDIVNGLLSSFSDSDELEKNRIAEKHCFSIFICLWGIRYHLESISTLAKYLSFKPATEQASKATEAVAKMQGEIVDALGKRQFPTGWVKKIVDGIH